MLLRTTLPNTILAVFLASATLLSVGGCGGDSEEANESPSAAVSPSGGSTSDSNPPSASEPPAEPLDPAIAAELPHFAALGKAVTRTRSLRDRLGSRRALREFQGERAVVLVFLGIECPVANREVPKYVALEKEMRGRGAQFVAIYPHSHETRDLVAAHAFDRDIAFPVFQDIDQKLSDALGVTRTPHTVVLDSELAVRYSGRFSDQFGVGHRKKAPSREDLRAAIEDVLAGRDVRVPITETEGCLLDRTPEPSPLEGITFSEHVAPLLQKRCESCHRPGQAAPFSLLTYDDAKRWSRTIREVVVEKRMPPWQADARYGHFQNDRSLDPEEIETLVSWIDSGMERGDPSKLPPPVQYNQGWTLGEPDAVIESPIAFDIPAEGDEVFEFVLVPNSVTDAVFTEDKWIQWGEIVPSETTVTHHVLAYICHPGDEIKSDNVEAVTVGVFGWVPGEPVWAFPEGSAMYVPKGAQLFLEVHYVPTGIAETDRPKIGFKFADEPENLLELSSRSIGEIAIPPHDPDHRRGGFVDLPRKTRILGLMGHMHARGKSFAFDALYPDGREERLLSVPRYDFNWQNFHWLEEPLEVEAGTRIQISARFDNSKYNLLNPDPDAEVHYGWEYTAEMLIGWVYHESERTPATLAAREYRRGIALAMQSRFDEAVDQYKKALAIDSSHAGTHNSLGVAYRQLNRIAEAESAFRAAVRAEPNFPEAWKNLAGMQLRQEKWNEALPTIRAILRAQPEDPVAHRNLVQVLLRAGKPNEAAVALRAAAKKFPNDPALQNMLAQMQRAGVRQ